MERFKEFNIVDTRSMNAVRKQNNIPLNQAKRMMVDMGFMPSRQVKIKTTSTGDRFQSLYIKYDFKNEFYNSSPMFDRYDLLLRNKY